MFAEKVNKNAINNWKIKNLIFLKGKQKFKIIIALKVNNICPVPLQLNVTFIPELLQKISWPFNTDANPKVFNNNHVKNEDIGERIIDKGINIPLVIGNNNDIKNGL